MNAGLGNLTLLKAHLQGIALPAETRFDAVIQDIGLGVAEQMENFCDRRFARVLGDAHVCMADRATISLPRYPLEAVTGLAIKFDEADGWLTVTLPVNGVGGGQILGPNGQPIGTVGSAPAIQTIGRQSGLLYLTAGDGSGSYYDVDAGPFWAQLQFTYDGGFFWEQLEPTDPGYPTAQPAASTALPTDLKLCWLTQCRRVWSAFDKLGAKITDNSAAAQAALATLDWSPAARKILIHHRRMQLV